MPLETVINIFKHYVLALVKATLSHLFAELPTASVWDLKTTLKIVLIRAVMTDPKPGRLLDQQKTSLHPQRIQEGMCIVEDVFLLPDKTNVKEIVYRVIQDLGGGQETFADVEALPISGEWVKHCTHGQLSNGQVTKSSYTHDSVRKPDELKTPTVLFFHGGQFWRKDPTTHRTMTYELARDIGGQCFVPRYRLAPQNPFPAALLDCLIAYLSLIFPPSDARYYATPAKQIAFAGDSSGGNISIALLQLILEIRRQMNSGAIKLFWQGQVVDLPLPGAVTSLSPYLDLTRAFESEDINQPFDIIPPQGPPFMGYEQDEIWPASPARHHVYANDDALLHPLVSPNTARNWKSSPPTWICAGQECLVDMAIFTAKQMTQQGVPVVFEQYEAMPHSFPLILEDVPATRHCMRRWAKFIHEAIVEPKMIQSVGLRWSGRVLGPKMLDMETLVSVDLETVTQKMSAELRRWGSPPMRVDSIDGDEKMRAGLLADEIQELLSQT